jgi:hypothetical protein
MSNTQFQPVSTQQMQLCFRTKKEMHTFLTESGRAYLPKVAAVKIEFMKQVMIGKKEVSDIKAIQKSSSTTNIAYLAL